MEDNNLWHYRSPQERISLKQKRIGRGIIVEDAFVKKLNELAKEDESIYFITADLGFGVFDEFSKNYPNQYLNVGVAEQNMTGIAARLALEGRKVFYLYSKFCYFEMFRTNKK